MQLVLPTCQPAIILVAGEGLAEDSSQALIQQAQLIQNRTGPGLRGRWNPCVCACIQPSLRQALISHLLQARAGFSGARL